MTVPDDYIRKNKAAWEEAFERAGPAWGADVVGRLRGERLPFLSKQLAAAVAQLDLGGKTVGQFCCNNGRELLSVVKHGAERGFGFDLAENQVAFASRAAEELGLPCEFTATDVLELPSRFNNTLDLLLITIGSLTWFHDLSPLFEKAARCLKAGGMVLINEQHPVTNMLAIRGEDNYDETRPASLANSYFEKTWVENGGMFYMTKKSYRSKAFTSYTHPMSAMLNAAIASGLRIKKLTESEHDLSAGDFADLEDKGIPLSYLLELRL